MAADIPTTEPGALRAGDTWQWTRSLDDYPAGTWTLKYSLVKAGGGTQKTITATASGTDHSITVAKATTAAYAAGRWDWIATVTDGNSRFTVDSGVLTVQPDIEAATTGYDARSHARKALDAIEAWIEARDPGVAEYEIAGRRMKYWSPADLIRWRQKYLAEVAAEANAEKLARGEGIGRRLQFRI